MCVVHGLTTQNLSSSVHVVGNMPQNRSTWRPSMLWQARICAHLYKEMIAAAFCNLLNGQFSIFGSVLDPFVLTALMYNRLFIY